MTSGLLDSSCFNSLTGGLAPAQAADSSSTLLVMTVSAHGGGRICARFIAWAAANGLTARSQISVRKIPDKLQKEARMRRNRLVASVLACSLLVSGCTTMKRIQPATAPAQPAYLPLKPGDTFIVRTADGEQGPFVIDRIDGDTIVAHGGNRFTRQEVVQLEHRALSGPTTAILVVGIVAAAVVIAVGIWLTKNSR